MLVVVISLDYRSYSRLNLRAFPSMRDHLGVKRERMTLREQLEFKESQPNSHLIVVEAPFIPHEADLQGMT